MSEDKKEKQSPKIESEILIEKARASSGNADQIRHQTNQTHRQN